MSESGIETVLVANRGEIAVRLIDACHALGLRAAAVYSDADRDALHVARADTAVHIGPAPAVDSYLNISVLLEAARTVQADAVHPGYGFLAENARFARACGDAGLVFIGPHPQAIELMGAKSSAKTVAARAGLPTVPGYHGESQDDAVLTAEAARIGWPLLIKATAGGGGRGMRCVDAPQELPAALAAARAEAEAAFGDPALLLERFIPRARHLEVQILGDRHGNVVHLLDRDCSVQRNHQKLIEEAPAPNLPDALRRDLRHWAVELSRAIGYDSAGTVEFVYDEAAGQAWFLEMNTRLQVEHPVTEAITGIDLAAWQIRIASGEAMDFGQDEVGATGWAIEARVAAEDPASDYAPRTGTIRHWRPPAGPGLRTDSGVGTGSTVGHHYDSMLAKVIAHGRDRDEARRRLRRALGGLEAVGVALNTAFLRELLALPAFVAGRQHTGLIDETWPDGWRVPGLEPECLVEAALAAHLSPDPMANAGPWSALGAWRVTEAAGRPGAAIHHVRVADGTVYCVRLSGRQGHYTAELEDSGPIEIGAASFKRNRLVCEIGETRRDTVAMFERGSVTLMRPDGSVTLAVLRPEEALLGRAAANAGEGSIVAPMPGVLVEVRVEPGQSVRAGDVLCVLEAMKLFQELAAPFDGTVTELRCKVGDTVAGGAPLAVVTSAAISSPTNPENQQ
jgi:acetyl/propionyl-CoA carboxylase alpha subunit